MGLLDRFAETVTADLSVDELCELLANARRRKVIDFAPEALTKRELADAIRDYEGLEGEKGSQSVYASLHQTHLPLLREHAVITEGDIIQPGESWAGVRAALNDLRERADG